MHRWFGLLCLAACGGKETVDSGGFDPLADDDGDGLANQEELDLGLDPANPDSDGDGFQDGREVRANTNALDAEDFPYAGGWKIGACRDSVMPTGDNVGDVAEDFRLQDQYGEWIRLHAFCDRVVLVASMTTEPEDAMEDLADTLQALHAAHERRGFIVLTALGPGTQGEPTVEDAAAWAAENEITHPVLVDTGWEVTRRFTAGAEPSPPRFSAYGFDAKLAFVNADYDENAVLALLDE